MQDMAGSDSRQLPPLRDLSRRAFSFLRMARLALTGAATPAQLLAGEEAVDGHSCDPYYKSVSTEDDWESSELWMDEEDESELLVEDEDGSTARGVGVSENRSALGLAGGGGGGGGGSLNKKSRQFGHMPAATMPEHGTAAEPLMMPGRATKRVNDAVVVDHPFGRDRQGSEASSLLLVSS